MLFASANMFHPQARAEAGRSGPVALFARNRLCALAQPEVDVTTDTLLDTLLDQGTRLGTSTPKADPSGDYAWGRCSRGPRPSGPARRQSCRARRCN